MKKIVFVIIASFLMAALLTPTFYKRASAFESEDLVKKETEPVYVSIVLHYEESFILTAPYFLRQRGELLALADFLHENKIKLNLQPDWAFMQAINQFENDQMRLVSNGKNILKYLVEDLDHEVNPHAHEHGYNYADVAYMIHDLGVDPGNIVGGLIVEPPKDSKYNYITQPISASHFDFTWQAQWLWGGGSANHINDTTAAGVWRPKDAYHFFEHDDQAQLPCIGKYVNDIDGVFELIAKSENGETEPGRMLTASIFIAQEKVSEMHDLLVSVLNDLKTYEAEGKIVFAPLSEVAETWTDKYEGQGYLYIQPPPYNHTYYLPYYSSADNYWTGLGLADRHQGYSTQLRVTVYDRSGNPLAAENRTIPAYGQLAFPLATQINNNGWVRIETQRPVSGLAFLGNNDAPSLMLDIPFVAELSSCLVIPHIAQDDTWDTTILICNPNNEVASVVLKYFDQIGIEQGAQNHTIPALGSGKYLLSTLFGDKLPLAGRVEIDSSNGIAAFALFSNQKTGGTYYAGTNADSCE